MYSKPTINRFWSKVKLPNTIGSDECWEWQGALSHGYGAFSIEGRILRSHRIAFEIARGPIPEDLFICHTCDNPKCVNPAHLWAGTNQDNITDMIQKQRSKGNRPTGIEHHQSKLTPDIVRMIRKMKAQGYSYQQIAQRFNVGKTTVMYAVSRRTWREVL